MSGEVEVVEPLSGSVSSTTATTTGGTLADPLADPLTMAQSIQGTATAGIKGASKLGLGAFQAGKSLYDASKKGKGEEARYAFNPVTGMVDQEVRGLDTEHANGFQIELAKDKVEKGVHKGVKTLTGGAKSSAKIIGSLAPYDVGDEVLDTVDPLKAIGQMASGAHKVVQSGIDVGRFQHRKEAAREGQELAEARNSPLAMGLGATKRGISDSRNEAAVGVGLGGLEAATGALGMAQFVDPTGATAAAHKVVGTANKAAKKGNLVRRAIKGGQRFEKVQKKRAAAESGDPEAKKWLLENDPRMASAQLLMHAQTGEEDDQAFARDQIANTLSLGDDAKEELGTGRLSEFDKLYANRTGQNIESQISAKEAGVYKLIGSKYNKVKKAAKGIKKGFKKTFGKDKTSKAPTRSMSDNDLADQYTALTKVLEREEYLKDDDGNISESDMDKAWDSESGLAPESRPDRGLQEVREYEKVKNFRVDKTYDELVDKAEQKSLKKRFKVEEGDEKNTGELFNMDQYATSTKAIDGTYDHMLSKSAKAKNKVADKLGPYAKSSAIPKDIRAALIAKERARRRNGETAGMNLPTSAPTHPDWQEEQAAHALDTKETRGAVKEAGTLPGQLAKAERKASAKSEKQAAKDAKKASKASAKADKKAMKASARASKKKAKKRAKGA